MRGQGCAGSARILICDDETAFVAELASGLTAAGFVVMTMSSAAAIQATVEEFVPDIVMLDIFMPPPDGFEVMNQLRDTPRQNEISWILMSGAGNNLLDVAARFCVARRMRLAATFQKPLNLGEIVRLCTVHAAGG